jgi:hypothetical protein
MATISKPKTSATSSKSTTSVIVPLIFGTIGAVALIRGLWRPARALVWAGKVTKCSGTSAGICDPVDTIETNKGEPVFSVTAGKVVAVGDVFVQVSSSYETAIIFYQGLVPGVKLNDQVGVGSQLGLSSGVLSFGVVQMVPDKTTSGGRMQWVAPGAWLVARGMSHVQGKSSELWCDKPRNATVPADVRKVCDFQLPEKPGFTLLPITVDQS